MGRANRVVVVLALSSALALAACGDDDDSEDVTFQVHVTPAPLPESGSPNGDRCPRGQGDRRLLRSEITELRVTFLDARTGNFLCDNVFSTATGESQKLVVPRF